MSRDLLAPLAVAAVVAVAATGCAGGGGEVASPVQRSGTQSPHPVAGNFKPDRRTLAGCEGDQACLEQAFGNVAYRTGPKAAIELLDERMRSDAAVQADCHRIAHTIGSAALARYRGNVARAFAQGSSSCWSGYYHGILERAFSGAASGADLGRVSRGLCDDALIRRTDWLAYQCVHGLGHGLMIHTGYNLPFSLSVCDRLATAWDQTSCTGGVFMENINSSYGVKSPWLKDDDLVYPCDVVKRRHKLYCYLMVTSRILQANGYNWRKAARICSRVERAWISTCFQSYGRDASGFTRQSPTEILRLCRIAGRGANDCLYGAARDLTANDANGKRAARLCELAAAPMRSRCFFGIGTILTGFSPDPGNHRAGCAALTHAFFRACLRGAGDVLEK
ncbi:MAG: hypothetical protein M3322_08560 [Actinomycetota bacterium]|nr:hypothetical protein [Actinomycetota bacterium]